MYGRNDRFGLGWVEGGGGGIGELAEVDSIAGVEYWRWH
jgi:hypothetical protein